MNFKTADVGIEINTIVNVYMYAYNVYIYIYIHIFISRPRYTCYICMYICIQAS